MVQPMQVRARGLRDQREPAVTRVNRVLFVVKAGKRTPKTRNDARLTPALVGLKDIDFPTAVGNQQNGGRLAHYWRNWEAIGTDPYLLSVIKDGYRFRFHSLPVLTTKPMFTSLPQDPVRRQALLEAVESLLHKQVVEVVENVSSPGFYSRFFVVPKMTVRKWRLILDLHILNRDHIRTLQFKMDTAELVWQNLKEGDWATSVDLTDAYFQVKVQASSRKYLRFGILGKVTSSGR